jgi:hypothetical protein
MLDHVIVGTLPPAGPVISASKRLGWAVGSERVSIHTLQIANAFQKTR